MRSDGIVVFAAFGVLMCTRSLPVGDNVRLDIQNAASGTTVNLTDGGLPVVVAERLLRGIADWAIMPNMLIRATPIEGSTE